MGHSEGSPTTSQHEARHRRLMWALGVVSIAAGYALTYAFPTDDWPTWRRIGAGTGMGLWCAYLVTLTRAGGAFK